DGWIFAPGYPLVSVGVEGNQLVLRQQRFTYLPEPLRWYGAAAGASPAPGRWQVPVQLRVIAGGRETVERVLLAEPEVRRPLPAALGWTPRETDDELTRQLRGDLIRALGTLGNDRDVQARAAELYAAHERGAAVDPNVLPALIAVLAHTGDEARYETFLERF